jgi:chromosomal replication initiator protein
VIPPEGDHLLPVERESGDSDRLHPLREQTLENFVVGASNQLAYSAVLQILESPGSLYNPLFVHGPSGVGKTHLLKGICRSFRHRRVAPRESSGHGRHPTYARAAYVTGEQFFHHYSSSVQDGTSRKFRERFRSLDVLVVDDVQLLINKKKTQLEFLQTFNALVDAGRQIVVASDVPPKTLKDLEPGLVGRFLSGLVVAIKRPDYATRLGIVRAQASRMPSRIDDRVLQYLAENVRGDARELVSALMQLDIRAQLGGGSLGFEESKEILGDFVREQKKKIDLRKICDACASHFALPVETLTSRNRQRHVSLARQVAMFLARRFTDKSLAEIGKYFGNRNHTTVKCAEVKIARLLDGAGGGLSREVRAIVESLEE